MGSNLLPSLSMKTKELKNIFSDLKFNLPIAIDGEYWNGRPGKWSNIKNNRIKMSQRFAMTMLDYSQFGMKGHNGVDIAGKTGTPIVAPCRMWIAQVRPENEDKGYGNAIWAESETIKLNGVSYKLSFSLGHLDSFSSNAKSGHWVEAGTILGLMGSTGFSTGPHLHLGIRPLKSENGNTWTQIYANNGYLGYIDPEIFLPYMVWDWQELINLDNLMANNEKKLVIEGEGHGRVGVIVNGKLREITKDRAPQACLYVLANNGYGKTISSDDFDKIEKDEDF